MSELVTGYVLPCLWASLACIGFGLVFNIQGVGVLICGLGAGLGWLVYLVAVAVGTGDIFAAFLAAIAIGIYSEVMARIRRCPVTGYLQVALLPLVPGAGILHHAVLRGGRDPAVPVHPAAHVRLCRRPVGGSHADHLGAAGAAASFSQRGDVTTFPSGGPH